MNLQEISPLPISLAIVSAFLAIALVLSFFRLLKGPTIPDRVVALNLISMILMGLITLFAILNEQSVFIDVVGVIALVSFLGTIAYVVHLEKAGSHV